MGTCMTSGKSEKIMGKYFIYVFFMGKGNEFFSLEKGNPCFFLRFYSTFMDDFQISWLLRSWSRLYRGHNETHT